MSETNTHRLALAPELARGTNMVDPTHVTLRVHCGICRGAVELECEGVPGFWGYETYNAYFCPHCRKQNHERTFGAVVAARVWMDSDLRPSPAEPSASR